MSLALIPKTAILEVTYRCNHECLFCSVPWESPRGSYAVARELDIPAWKECVDSLVAGGVRTFAFSGGEPLLKEGLVDLISYVREQTVYEPVFDGAGNTLGVESLHPSISLITNGELIDEEWAGCLKGQRVSVTVSLPGVSSFKELTGGGDSQKVLEAIRILSQAGLDVTVSICVTKKNLPELYETIALGFLHGAKGLLLNRFLLGGRGLNYPELSLDVPAITVMLDTAEKACLEANTFGSVGTELPKCILKKEYKMLKVGTRCSGGREFFAVDPSGRLRPCNHSPVSLGSYANIAQALETPYWRKFREKTFLPPSCGGCALSLKCDGGCREAAHIVSGALDSVDPVFA